jgi:hypothetical protein
VAFTNPVTAGNSVIVALCYTGNAPGTTITSVNDNLGNTYTQQQSLSRATSSPTAIYTALGVTNAPQTITIVTGNTTSTVLRTAATIYEDTNTVLDNVFTGTTTNSTALVASLTTAAANESAYAVVSTNNGSETYTQNNGWTQDYVDAGQTGSFYFHDVLSGSGANSLNMTASVAVYDLWGIIALKPGASGVTVAITANSASFTAGAVAPASSLAISADTATFTPGTLALAARSFGLIGASASFTAGALAPLYTRSIAGVSASFIAGSVVPSLQISMTGRLASFTQGTFLASGGIIVAPVFPGWIFGPQTVEVSVLRGAAINVALIESGAGINATVLH